jgi:DNA-binding ferritin-like protein (Dps family)
MNKEEFETYTKKIVDTLGDDVAGFFAVINNTFEYFTTSDDIIKETQISLKEFEAMTNKITKLLGRKESVRFFKAVYDALPKETITYMSVMVRIFEKFI